MQPKSDNSWCIFGWVSKDVRKVAVERNKNPSALNGSDAHHGIIDAAEAEFENRHRVVPHGSQCVCV